MHEQNCYFAQKTKRFWRSYCGRRRGCLSYLNWFLLPSQRLQKWRPAEICATDTRVRVRLCACFWLLVTTVLKGHYHVIWKTSKINFDGGLIKRGSRVTLKSSFYNMYPFPSKNSPKIGVAAAFSIWEEILINKKSKKMARYGIQMTVPH